jgi:ABC-type Fe3+-hydroxamate transport system substrate-binding protein
MCYPYNRIISLVPSLTELIIDLGLQEQLVGRTRFCVHPKNAVKDIPIIGGTKNPRLEKIADLNPDFIIANREENREQDIRQLQEDYPVDVTEIETIENALLVIHRLGEKLGVSEMAEQLINKISTRLEQRPDEPPLRTVYFIWKEPWMTIGGDTYIHDVMNHWKLHNIFGSQERYPKIPLDELADYDPELILLSSEPFPFKEKHLPEVQQACPDARVLLVEGEWFSWYGSRMLSAFERLNVWRKAIA